MGPQQSGSVFVILLALAKFAQQAFLASRTGAPMDPARLGPQIGLAVVLGILAAWIAAQAGNRWVRAFIRFLVPGLLAPICQVAYRAALAKDIPTQIPMVIQVEAQGWFTISAIAVVLALIVSPILPRGTWE